MSSSRFWHRLFFGALLIAVGVGFLVENLTDYNIAWGDWWPVILIGLGVLNVPSSRWVGGLLLFVGAVFLVDNLDILDLDIGDFWPVFLVVAGLLVIFGGRANWRTRGKQPRKASSADILDVSSVFGGSEQLVTSQNFRGGSVSANFGSVTIDLRGASLADGAATLQVDAIFGSAEIFVPSDWMVNIQTSGNFGGVELKRAQPAAAVATLTVTGSCTFGSITIA